VSWLGNLLAGLFGGAGAALPVSAAGAQRQAEWESALQAQRLPSFVEARLGAAAAGRAPWVATMSAAELVLARSKGIRPLAMVSGTCWFHYGWSWTEGHGAGWRQALARLKQEAAACGANAVVDVKMRKVRLALGESMDFTLVGTAVRLDSLPAGGDPVVATVPALAFVRLLQADIVPVGIAIGAQYDYLQNFSVTWGCRPLPEVGRFWERIRRRALKELQADAQRQGNGVLAHTHLGQLFRIEQGDSPRLLGRHIVVGTVVDTSRSPDGIPAEIRAVVDMRDDLSPLSYPAVSGHNAYPVEEEEGAI
jgi:uncharacterized protein YbjQ (UPF0145 family)